ncbi:MAG TPA: ArsR family transcriptional regulator [Thermomicrobiales bacterium]|jgi:DNA-binding transcriptional ArsR family regulator|nr:ArsR family transcriptional regulator [Thermomicrobiales bacterium]
MSDSFEPVAFQIVSDPQQLKAFTDPLRNRILRVLNEREATNQQLAAALGAPQARVLYHVRFLLDVGLIRLVSERVRGGNVEKYYRATSLLFGLRPGPGEATAVSSAVLGAVLQDLGHSEARWPDELTNWEIRRLRLAPERREEFRLRLNALIAEYWGGPNGAVDDDPDGELFTFASLLFRSALDGLPGVTGPDSVQSNAAEPDAAGQLESDR